MHPKTSKYKASQKVILKDGNSGTIIGVDPMDREYQIMTSDNRAISVKATDIEKVEKPKDDKYQESGINPENKSEINIKGTPFDLDPDK